MESINQLLQLIPKYSSLAGALQTFIGLVLSAAVVLAFVAGLAVVTALRVIVKTGAEIGGETLQIPLPGH
jgi:hypothetical protein